MPDHDCYATTPRYTHAYAYLAGVITALLFAVLIGCGPERCGVICDSDIRQTPDETIEPMSDDAWKQPQYDHHELRREP